MNSVVVKVESPLETLSLASAADLVGVPVGKLDKLYGVVLVDGSRGLWAVRVLDSDALPGYQR